MVFEDLNNSAYFERYGRLFRKNTIMYRNGDLFPAIKWRVIYTFSQNSIIVH